MPPFTVSEPAVDVDLKMPAPGDQGYDEWRKTGKLPEAQEIEAEQETPPKKETPAASETPSATESAVKQPAEEVETAAASEAARPQKGRTDSEARVKKLLSERKEDQRLLRDALERLARLELPDKRDTPPAPAAPEGEKKPKAEAAKPEPQLDDKGPDGAPKYKTYSEYQRDWSKWVMGEAVREAKAAATDTTSKSQKQQEMDRAQQVIAQVWSGRVNEARKKYADYDAVALNPELPIKQGSITDAFILDSDYGTDVLYHLAKNPAELTRIQTLNPLAQARELFKIEQTFVGPPKPAPKPAPAKVTQAPPPPHQVQGKTAAALDEVEQAVKEEDFEAYRTSANERELEKRRAGLRRRA
jgi:hypothetical protein